jgi:hypothetical protein
VIVQRSKPFVDRPAPFLVIMKFQAAALIALLGYASAGSPQISVSRTIR